MFNGFNLTGFGTGFFSSRDYRLECLKRGRSVTAEGRTTVQRELVKIASNKAVLNGAKIQETWFPQVHADIFRSHSRLNENLVMMLAGWLDLRFGLKAFVDSAIWSYAGDLIKIIDEKYCWLPESRTYNYRLRNESTSHVHMMLMTALGMMIHKTECLIFVNTPDSIAPFDVVNLDQTLSPWIYAELTMAGIVEKVTPVRHIETTLSLASGKKIEINIAHSLPELKRFHKITPISLGNWSKDCRKMNERGDKAIDSLYTIAAI